jgi:tetratricopeptide (TPR) repeat protein
MGAKYIKLLKLIVISSGILFALLSSDDIAQSEELSSNEKEYLLQKSLGNYEKSINTIVAWTRGIDDHALIDINLLRIFELLDYPEMVDVGISAFNKISGYKAVASSKYLMDRIDMLKGILLFNRGDTTTIKGFKQKFGYIDKFRIIGPFSNRNRKEFEKPHLPSVYDNDLSLMGKNYYVSWFDIRSDWIGIVDIGELFSDIGDSLFYLHREVGIDKSGVYKLSLGKTGYTDIWIDGKKVFSNREEHGYFFDQYVIEVFLPQGRHDLMIKMGNSAGGGAKLSLRITGSDGEAINVNHPGEVDTVKKECRLIKSSYFSTLENIRARGLNKPYPSFLAAYIFYICNLNSFHSNEAKSLFLNAEKLKSLTPALYFYIGMIERDSINKEHYFYQSLKEKKKNIEALYQIAQIKLSKKFVYEAYPLIESIGRTGKNSVQHLFLKAIAFISMGWFDEALRVAERLKNSESPSAGYLVEGRILRKQKKYKRAFNAYQRLYESEKRNWTYILNAVSCATKAGDYDAALKILNEASLLFPNSVKAKLMHSDLIDKIYGVKASIPYLSSAKKISPYNKQVLLRIGIAYHKIGRGELAQYYLKMASSYDPKNFSLRRYLKIIRGEYSEIEDLLFNRDLIVLLKKAEKYKSEPAITLLDELAIRLFSDGSTERRVHQIFKINDKSVIKDFSYQHIIIDPAYDKVEDLKCIVINDGDRVEVTSVYNRSLSHPESRLYYDLQAKIISVPSLRKGSIIDLRYVVKRRRSEAFKKYFGEKYIAGREFRTLISNIILSFPDNKRINYYLNGIEKNDFRLIKKGKRKIYRIYIENLPPYKKEASMPHFSEILPAVYFTSHKDWGELHGWYLSLLRDRIKVSPEMRNVLNKIIDRDDSVLEKVKKVYNHVNEQIRYVGFEFGIGGIQPRSSELTYHTRMGDCKDISLVLVAMLKEIGVDARLALIRTRDRGKANLKVPYLGEFNHAICYVGSGLRLFLDGTSKSSGIRELPSDDLDVTVLVLDEKGYNFVNTHSSYYHSNLERVTTDVIVNEKGDAELYRSLYKIGVLASGMRSGMKDREKKLKSVSAYWNKHYTGSSIKELKVYKIDNDAPVKYEYRISIPSFLNVGKEENIFSSFLMPSDYYRNYAILKKRKNPLMFSSKWVSHITIRYHLPANSEIVRIPENADFKHRKFDAIFKYKRSLKGNVIEVESLLKFKGYRVEVGEYDLFRKFARFIHKKENEKIIFKMKRD